MINWLQSLRSTFITFSFMQISGSACKKRLSAKDFSNFIDTVEDVSMIRYRFLTALTTFAITLSVGAMLSLFPSALVQSAPPASSLASASQGIYEIASAADRAFVVDAVHCTVQESDSHALQMFHPLDVNQQKFYLETLPDASCRFTVLCSGEALTVSGDDVFLAGLTQTDDADKSSAAPAQTWNVQKADTSDHTFYIRSSSGKYLTLGATRAYKGASLTMSDFTGRSNQRWVLTPALVSSTDTADTDLIDPYAKDGRYEHLRLSLRFGNQTETLYASDFSDHMTETDDHRLILDPEFLPSYVSGLAQKYDTQGTPKRFTTSYGEEITLYKGNFGWKLDEAGTAALLQDALDTGKAGTLLPVWSHEGGAFHGADDIIGDSYIEIDLENQKVWLYKDGKKLLETDCVSGTFGTDRQTPAGVYSIFYMQSPDILNGADYASEVEYFMAYNGNIGLHDAQWRSEFGGDRFLTDGSHGCINLPPDAARKIYETVSIGYPVVSYQ